MKKKKKNGVRTARTTTCISKNTSMYTQTNKHPYSYTCYSLFHSKLHPTFKLLAHYRLSKLKLKVLYFTCDENDLNRSHLSTSLTDDVCNLVVNVLPSSFDKCLQYLMCVFLQSQFLFSEVISALWLLGMLFQELV